MNCFKAQKPILLGGLFFWILSSTSLAAPRWVAEGNDILHVRLGIADPALDFTMNTPGNDATFTTNTPAAPFIDVAYKSLAVGVRMPAKADEESVQKLGRSQSTDLQFRIFGHRTSPEFIYQKFRGYYPEKWVDSNGDQIIRSDISSEVFAFNIIQSLSPDFFTQAVAFDQRGVQVASGGSLLLFLSASRVKIHGDSALLPAISQGSSGQVGLLSSYHSDSILIGTGYGWSLPFLNRLCFSGALLAGVGYHFYDLDLGSETMMSDALVQRLGVRLDLGYNHLNYFGGFQLLVDTNEATLLDSKIQHATIITKLSFGYRFGSVQSSILDNIDSTLTPLRF